MKSFQIHIAGAIPTSYENAKVGGLRGQHRRLGATVPT
jgi:hypothetical protein